MALYQNSEFLAKTTDPAFDTESEPGTSAPFSGIYRCRGCGREIASNESEPLPPQNHHQHEPSQGFIRWRLIVYADHKPK